MKHYLCIVGNFDGADIIYQECVDRGIYQYYKEAKQKGPVADIRTGDMLFLVYKKTSLDIRQHI